MVAGRGVQVLWQRVCSVGVGAIPVHHHHYQRMCATTRGRSTAARLADYSAMGKRMYSSDNLGFSSSSRKLKWGFVEAGEALAAHRARPINQNASLLLWITSNTLQLCSVEQADIEEGARQAYRHIAELYNEGSSEAWLSQRLSVISRDLAQEFASQADSYKVNGIRPRLRIESVDARVLYAVWLPEDMSVDFRLSDYPDAASPWGRMSRWIGWNAAKFRTMTKFVRQVRLSRDTCAHSHITAIDLSRILAITRRCPLSLSLSPPLPILVCNSPLASQPFIPPPLPPLLVQATWRVRLRVREGGRGARPPFRTRSLQTF